jgi:hypothetical protein
VENSRLLMTAGLVSGAVFSDLEGDGHPDLILACEWGPIRIYRNVQGRFEEWNPRLHWVRPGPADVEDASASVNKDRELKRAGEVKVLSPALSGSGERGTLGDNTQSPTLSSLTGWWTGVTTGDFDGDGQLDIVATNWGRNTKYESHRTEAPSIFYGDFNENGLIGNFEAYFDPKLNKVVPWRDLASATQEFPWVRERFTSFTAYSTASVQEILGNRFTAARELRVTWLESTVFLNRGDSFEVRVLPVEAQFAPAFAACVADFDGDGCEDIFLSQNFFATQPETSRYDAGRGLWLRGDGRGGFKAVPGQESGVLVYGEQRGAAVADFDGDGRVDLVVTQNGAATKLYRNVKAKPGLRVRLEGPPGNPQGLGASVRARSRKGWGPVHEIHGGSGYWSQDSSTLVMGGADSVESVRARWPGGAMVASKIPAEAREVIINSFGKVTIVK